MRTLPLAVCWFFVVTSVAALISQPVGAHPPATSRPSRAVYVHCECEPTHIVTPQICPGLCDYQIDNENFTHGSCYTGLNSCLGNRIPCDGKVDYHLITPCEGVFTVACKAGCGLDCESSDSCVTMSMHCGSCVY
jgi:hypothetical protein